MKAFTGFQNLKGHVWQDADDHFITRLMEVDGEHPLNLELPGSTFYGFVQGGLAIVNNFPLKDGMWFCLPEAVRAHVIGPATKILVVEMPGFLGLPQFGGPIEAKGRLKYIDRCSDTLLVAPPRQGDPCLNHLHFPEGIDQTPHTHPSVRIGMVVRGRGECLADGEIIPLVPGLIFSIHTDGLHKFRTLLGTSMDVVAFHPDSDWGPTDEVHPMINRTWVEGKKVDNSTGVHQQAEIIHGRA